MVNRVPYCPKCGAQIEENMGFCPKCGAALKADQAPAEAYPTRRYRRDEKEEKREKDEKQEKGEKREKREKGEVGLVGPVIGGLILVLIGVVSYLRMSGVWRGSEWAVFLIAVGLLVMFGAIYGAILASRRYPKPLEERPKQ